MSALGERCTSCCVRDAEGIAGRWVSRPGTSHLSVEQPTRPRVQRLAGRQIELVDDGGAIAAVTLTDGTAHGIVQTVEANTTRVLYGNRDGERGDARRVTQPHSFVVKPRLVGVDDRGYGHSAIASSRRTHCQRNRGGMTQRS